ncbi:hypothetical protein BJ742DRAFT_840529 [Cladochytrium replicatum]|nr:hypothetical protein BJ742DRAFT_840529 [Cladochytrium replicatum]
MGSTNLRTSDDPNRGSPPFWKPERSSESLSRPSTDFEGSSLSLSARLKFCSTTAAIVDTESNTIAGTSKIWNAQLRSHLHTLDFHFTSTLIARPISAIDEVGILKSQCIRSPTRSATEWNSVASLQAYLSKILKPQLQRRNIVLSERGVQGSLPKLFICDNIYSQTPEVVRRGLSMNGVVDGEGKLFVAISWSPASYTEEEFRKLRNRNLIVALQRIASNPRVPLPSGRWIRLSKSVVLMSIVGSTAELYIFDEKDLITARYSLISNKGTITGRRVLWTGNLGSIVNWLEPKSAPMLSEVVLKSLML